MLRCACRHYVFITLLYCYFAVSAAAAADAALRYDAFSPLRHADIAAMSVAARFSPIFRRHYAIERFSLADVFRPLPPR